MSSLRVLHVFKTYFPDGYGGVEQTIKQICLSTTELGITNRILTLSKNPKPKILSQVEAEVYRYAENFNLAATGFSVQAIHGFRQLAAWADVIHYHFPWPFADFLNFFSHHKKPSLVTYHSDIMRQKRLLWFYRPLMNHFLKHVNAIIATSPNYLETSKVLNKFRHKTYVVPFGLDKATYPSVESVRLQFWKGKLGVDFFLFVGVLRYYKGVHFLLEAMKNTNFQLVIVGSGPNETKLKAQAQLLNLNNVHFLGALPDEDKIALLQLCCALVFPSHLRSEAFGISLLEGAMYGKPLISCEIGTGSSYININETTGLVVPPENPQALQLAMNRLFHNREERLQMGENAALRFQQFFLAKDMAQEYVKLYRNLTAK